MSFSKWKRIICKHIVATYFNVVPGSAKKFEDEQNRLQEEYDALYLSGGEPKNLMDSIINSNNYEVIKEFIDNGGIVIGQSAGAMIFNKKYLDTTTGDLLTMDNGFNYYDRIIVLHYNDLSSELLDKIPDNILKINDNDKLYKLDV